MPKLRKNTAIPIARPCARLPKPPSQHGSDVPRISLLSTTAILGTSSPQDDENEQRIGRVDQYVDDVITYRVDAPQFIFEPKRCVGERPVVSL